MIDVRRVPELQAAIIACRRVDTDLRKAIFAASRKSVNALWQPGLGRRARSVAATRVIVQGARAAIRVDGFSLLAATSKRALRNGLVPTHEWAGYEFGAHNHKKTFEQKSRLGRSYSVTKTINKQFPARQPGARPAGLIAFDTASEVGTKTVAAWVQAVVTTIVNATGGERS